MQNEIKPLEFLVGILGVNLDTARRMCRTCGVGGAIKIGKKWFIHEPTFFRWVASQAEASFIVTEKRKAEKIFVAVHGVRREQKEINDKFEALLGLKSKRDDPRDTKGRRRR